MARGNVERQKSKGKPQSPKILSGRVNSDFSKEATQQAEAIVNSFSRLKKMLIGADYPCEPSKNFYQTADKKSAEVTHLKICGYGLSSFERAINSFGNRVVLWDEG